VNSSGYSWRKSTYSGGGSNECVEVAPASGVVLTRDSKDPARGHIAWQPDSWGALIEVLNSK
jgi:hypothetical protein